MLFRAFFDLARYKPGTRAVHGRSIRRGKKVGAIFGRRSKKGAKNPIYVGEGRGKALGRRTALTPLPAGCRSPGRYRARCGKGGWFCLGG